MTAGIAALGSDAVRRLVRELREPLPQLALEVLRITLELEAPHEVISKTHQICLAST
ncbi:hypothetical protein [Bradyrhizobium sp. CCBAU 65884]|uniref:hypothetical protein n=1 Tax=Bradyrhizobium sp. CCBAU 65884 TaxID=722477 RepID=UPI002304EEDB|nr:hypothetical protein [Bradyrhizobium sp. CCBAU 65884]